MRWTRRELIILLGGLVAGCSTAPHEPDYTVTIQRNATFEPSSLVVPAGSLIAWHNRADSVHTVTADPENVRHLQRVSLPEGALPFDSGNLFPGDRWVHTFDVPGSYIYGCRYHPSVEMFGSVTVTG
jgi:plastocyanin